MPMNKSVAYPTAAAATLAALMLGLLAGAVAHAQTATAPATASTSTSASTAASSEGLEEIMVTATRRSEALSRVPISVTALNQDAMDERRHQGFPVITGLLHARGQHRQRDHQCDLDPRHFFFGRSRHHRYLYRRYPDPDALGRLQPGRYAAEDLRVWITAWRYCADRRARCSEQAPKAARYATSSRRRN